MVSGLLALAGIALAGHVRCSASLLGLHFAFVSCVLPRGLLARGLLGHRTLIFGTLIFALLSALVFQALTGSLVLSALRAALTLHVALRGATSAQRKEQLRGLQGSTRAPMQGVTSTERGAGAANVSLNEQQRTQIRDTVINSRSAPRVSNVDFSVNVGTVVPRGHIHLVRVPETLIRIEPRWRHYLYFVFNNEIVIVEPRTMKIVQVLPV